ncbi:hypothetical protein [Clostridium cylindrosporum]|uniref:Uncharacterized protein n=1 Tax=Clostridium cylindrosporum DSM 605 TaxID=1121307 RepID=A0A0J8G6D5_CLOCY|nr:hypothetical protein [Clostridium cylindrosporum]KMT23166.1 hypothetical protein CLCY_6c00470 [Clostridium cylindrosporum DSM 605]
MEIKFNGQNCNIIFSKYENGNTEFKIYDENGKAILSPTVDIGYKMNKEYVTLKNRDMTDSLGKELQEAGVLLKKMDSVTLEHSGALSIYILTDKARENL